MNSVLKRKVFQNSVPEHKAFMKSAQKCHETQRLVSQVSTWASRVTTLTPREVEVERKLDEATSTIPINLRE